MNTLLSLCAEIALSESKAKQSPYDLKLVDAKPLAIALLPSGSGFDADPSFRMLNENAALTFTIPFHHMNPDGFYVGWSESTLRLKPCFIHGCKVSSLMVSDLPSHEDRQNFKDFLLDTYFQALLIDVDRRGILS